MKNNIDFSNNQFLPFIDWNIRFFGAHRQHVPINWSTSSEFHRSFEIIFIIKGVQETTLENETYVLEQGQLILIPPGFHHINKCISEEGMTYFCAHFDVDEPSLRIDMLKYCEIIFTSASPFYEVLKKTITKWIDIVSLSDNYSVKHKLKIQIILFELLEIFVEMITQKQKNQHQSMTITKYAKEIADAIRANFKKSYLHLGNDELDNNVLIQPIISSLGLSPNYGLEVFQKVYHMSPRKYLSELKLQEAKILMQQPDISLQEIANRLGYKNLSHFSRQFKRWTGLSPTEFKKNSIL